MKMRYPKLHRRIWGRRNVLMLSFWYFALIFSAFLYFTYAKWRPARVRGAIFNGLGVGEFSGSAIAFTELLRWQRAHNPSATSSHHIVASEDDADNTASVRSNQLVLHSNGDSSGNSDAKKSNHLWPVSGISTNEPHNTSVSGRSGRYSVTSGIRRLERDAEYEGDVEEVDSDEDIRLPVTDAMDLTTGRFENITIQRPLTATVEGYKRLESEEPLRLHCGRCAVVSSSGHLINQSRGSEIDSAHCVLRMNSAPTAGYEDDVGTRTTVRVIGHVNMLALNSSRKLQHEIFINQESRAEVVIVPWLGSVRLDKETNIYYRIAKKFSTIFSDVQLYILTPEKSKLAEDLFKSETGLTPREAHTWLTTGWMTLLFAIDVCEKIDIYGLVEDSHCRDHPNDSTPYHYYEPRGIIECEYYQKSEERLTGGHLFITEKAVFARWAYKFNFRFHVPVWNLTANVSLALETPFLKRFYQAKRNNRNTTGRTRRVIRKVVRRVIVRRRISVVKKTKP